MTACRTRHLPMMVFPEAKWCFPDQISAVQTAELDQTLDKHQSGNKRTFKVVISKISMSISLATPMAITEKILVDVTNSICVLTDVIINFSGTCKSKRELHLFFLTDIYLHGNFQGYYFKIKTCDFHSYCKKLLLCSGKIQILTSDSSLFAALHSAAQQSFRFNLESKHRVISMWRHFPAKRCWSISWKGESCAACPRAPTRF